MGLYVVGDIHGEWNRLECIVKELEKKDERVSLLVAGDFGVWSDFNYESLVRYAASFRDTTRIYITEGNHENYDLLAEFPIKERPEGLLREITPQIFYFLRGHFYNICGKSLLAFGGAVSIDKKHRIPGLSWWPQEDWSKEDEDRVAELLKSPQKVDIILTHEGPEEIVRKIVPYADNLGAWIRRGLQFIHEDFEYDYWFFGHYHKDEEIETDKGKIFCVYRHPIKII